MWNQRPLNTAGPDPFGLASKKTGGSTLSAESVKCPTCGSNIVFEPELGSMMCRNCGNMYSPDTMESRGSLGVSKEHDYMGDSDITGDDKNRHEIVCNSCGATLIADENTMSTMCPFCGSPALITRRMTREFKPDYIIPFKIDKDQAKDIAKKWLDSRQYVPWGFKNKCRLTTMTALYVPFWLLDCVVHSEQGGTGKIGGRALEVTAKMAYHVKGVPFDASVKIANKLMEAVEPYDYKDMVRFESKYLQGFYADKYDQVPTDITNRIVRRIDKFSRDEIGIISHRYQEFEVRSEKNLTWMSDASVKYCLLPVWFMTVEFEGSTYQFAINGQTGEASGQVPTTSTTDKLAAIGRITYSMWKFIPVALCLLIPAIMYAISFNGMLTGSLALAPLVKVLSVIEPILVALTVAFFVTIYVCRHISKKVRTGADLSNDFDKDPGLDSYLDSTKPADIDVKETELRFAHLVTDGEGNLYGARTVR